MKKIISVFLSLALVFATSLSFAANTASSEKQIVTSTQFVPMTDDAFVEHLMNDMRYSEEEAYAKLNEMRKEASNYQSHRSGLTTQSTSTYKDEVGTIIKMYYFETPSGYNTYGKEMVDCVLRSYYGAIPSVAADNKMTSGYSDVTYRRFLSVGDCAFLYSDNADFHWDRGIKRALLQSDGTINFKVNGNLVTKFTVSGSLAISFKLVGFSVGTEANSVARHYVKINETFDPNYIGGYFEP